MGTILDLNKNHYDDILKTVKNILINDGLVAIPSETVYGLGANAYSKIGVKRVYETKQREGDNPLICHVSSIEMIERIASIPDMTLFNQLIEEFFPGPLTLILLKKENIPICYASKGYETVAVRMPSAPFFLDLIKYCDFPIVAPSANISGRPSGTRWDVIQHELGDKIDMIIKGEIPLIGIESTVLDLTQNPPAILRPGAITLSDICRVSKNAIQSDHIKGDVIKSPGTKYRHYMPNFKIILCSTSKDFINQLKELNKQNIGNVATITPKEINCDSFSYFVSHQLFYHGEKDLSYHLYSWYYDLEKKEIPYLVIFFKPSSEFGDSILERIIKSSYSVL